MRLSAKLDHCQDRNVIVEQEQARSIDADLSLGTPDFRKSFLTTRLVVGLFGVTLPFVLILGEPLLTGNWVIRDALSDYYHSALRNWFVGSLFAIGAGLLVYMATKRSRPDGALSVVAGVCAIAVALFPTNKIDEEVTTIAVVHFVCAVMLLILLGVICWRFGTRDGTQPNRSDRRRTNWRRFHHSCAVIIWSAVVWCAFTVVLDVVADISVPYAVVFGESVAVLAFGFSWLLKGSELLTTVLNERGIPVWQSKPGSDP
jgi:hypothetical protein